MFGTKILIPWTIFYFFHTDLKAIEAFGSVKKVSVLYLSRFLRKPVLKLVPWCQ